LASESAAEQDRCPKYRRWRSDAGGSGLSCGASRCCRSCTATAKEESAFLFSSIQEITNVPDPLPEPVTVAPVAVAPEDPVFALAGAEVVMARSTVSDAGSIRYPLGHYIQMVTPWARQVEE
jgi:hypothetical protein